MKFFSYICNCVALDTGMCGPVVSLRIFEYLFTMMYDALCMVSEYRLGRGLIAD